MPEVNQAVLMNFYELQESHSEATGQVYELSADGHLLIRWANGKMSHCWPQELFLIGDEV